MNRLRLTPRTESAVKPAGLMLGADAVRAVAERLAKRARHYAALRVTGLQGGLVFWSVSDDVRLPWFDQDAVYLAQRDKTMFFPAGMVPDLPANWSERIVDRLAKAKGLSRPILLLASPGGVRVVGLGKSSVPLPAVDWQRLAAQ